MEYFLMSVKFNKQTPKDFGLERVGEKCIKMKDGTEWEACQLYDYGWGKENGFYKKPLGSFTELIKLVIDNRDKEDSYGAAAIIEDIYAKELKSFLLELMKTKVDYYTKQRLNEIFRLYQAVNKTFSADMSISDANQEYNDWKSIALFYSS